VSFSDKLDLVVRIQEPLDEEEWMGRVAKILLCTDNRHKSGSEVGRGKHKNE